MSAYEPLDADHYLNAPAVGECNRCHRKTWDAETIGTEDRMPQPDGGTCGGMFEANVVIRASTHRIRGAATGEQSVPVKPEQFDDWLARHDAEVAANTTLGIMHRLDTDDPRVGEQLVQFEDEWRKEARP